MFVIIIITIIILLLLNFFLRLKTMNFFKTRAIYFIFHIPNWNLVSVNKSSLSLNSLINNLINSLAFNASLIITNCPPANPQSSRITPRSHNNYPLIPNPPRTGSIRNHHPSYSRVCFYQPRRSLNFFGVQKSPPPRSRSRSRLSDRTTDARSPRASRVCLSPWARGRRSLHGYNGYTGALLSRVPLLPVMYGGSRCATKARRRRRRLFMHLVYRCTRRSCG